MKNFKRGDCQTVRKLVNDFVIIIFIKSCAALRKKKIPYKYRNVNIIN
jgi:hypothetical protein